MPELKKGKVGYGREDGRDKRQNRRIGESRERVEKDREEE